MFSLKANNFFHKILFVVFILSFALFTASGFFSNALLIKAAYRFSFAMCIALLLMAFVVLLSLFLDKKKENSGLKLFSFSLLRFSISFFLFALEMVIKTIIFGELFSS